VRTCVCACERSRMSWQGEAWTTYSLARDRLFLVYYRLCRTHHVSVQGWRAAERIVRIGDVYDQYFRMATMAIGIELSN
jgi:hypothetical protein